MSAIIDYFVDSPVVFIMILAVLPCVVCEVACAVYMAAKRRREQKERYNPIKR
jgi:hypothetical protein